VKLTIGMAACSNYAEVWFTVQALRLYQDLADTEILIIDNGPDCGIKKFVGGWAKDQVRYVAYTDVKGTAAPRDRIFAEAKGDWVMVIDSHVLLVPGAVARFRAWCDAHPDCRDLLHGPLLYDDLKSHADAMNDEWRQQFWGTWRAADVDPEADPYPIPMMGMGLYACRRDAWLGFNPAFRGFGGEEGYIHAKYRLAGREVLCLPFLRWNHHFRAGATPYPMNGADRIRNYKIGFDELGLDPAPIRREFGSRA
jgi:glycosyltransferase involved in cell wall biosynthesis